MQAVYELLTVAPYMPPRARFTRAELDVYVKGYERAIAQALKVMKPAAKRWEARFMRDYRPRFANASPAPPNTDAAGDEALDRRIWAVFHIAVVFAVIVGLEVIALLAALIYYFLR